MATKCPPLTRPVGDDANAALASLAAASEEAESVEGGTTTQSIFFYGPWVLNEPPIELFGEDEKLGGFMTKVVNLVNQMNEKELTSIGNMVCK